jgi:hypothetical protein
MMDWTIRRLTWDWTMVLETLRPKKRTLVTYNKSDDVEAKFKCSEKITAVQHGDGISFGSSPIYRYLLFF